MKALWFNLRLSFFFTWVFKHLSNNELHFTFDGIDIDEWEIITKRFYGRLYISTYHTVVRFDIGDVKLTLLDTWKKEDYL